MSLEMAQAAAAPPGLSLGYWDGRGVASETEFAKQEKAGPKEKSEGTSVGIVNFVEGREFEIVVKEAVVEVNGGRDIIVDDCRLF
jgi:hypothetical protein